MLEMSEFLVAGCKARRACIMTRTMTGLAGADEVAPHAMRMERNAAVKLF